MENLFHSDLGGCEFYYRKGTWDKAITDEVVSGDCYRVRNLTLPSGSILDVGAHIGAFSCFAHYLWPDRPVLAAEAHPENFAMLCQNAAHTDRIVPIHAAICREGRRAFMPMHAVGNTGGYAIAETGEVEVAGMSFASLVRLAGDIALVKTDCEGCEADVIDDLLANRWRIPLLVGEWHGAHMIAKLQSLQTLAYEVNITHSNSQIGYTGYPLYSSG